MNDHQARRIAHLDRVAALAATLPADAVISHESAAIALGLPTYDVPAAVRVTRTRGRGVRTSDVHVRCCSLRREDVTIVGDIPVTSPARTTVDLGRVLPFGAALITADAALRAGTARAEMHDVLRHQWTWPRVRHAMPVVRHADSDSESPLESFTRSRFVSLRLPLPLLQRDIVGEFGWVARCDFLWKRFRVAGEADGRVKYAATEDEIWAEKLRQEDIEDAGYEVIRWTWRAAHAPDDVFAARLWRKLDRCERLHRVLAS